MEIINKRVEDLTPYENNPRKNDEAVEYVANSIREFGFKVPIVIDKENVIVAGHTRLKAAEQLGLEEVPCIIADDLTEEQVKAYRLADNKTAEFALWDIDALDAEMNEIDGIDMSEFGFEDDFISEDDIDGGEVKDNQNAKVAVKIIFENSNEWRKKEEEVREFVDNLENVSVSLGVYDEDQQSNA